MRTYDSYKDSGIDWLGEIPSHWEVKKLKNILSSKLKYGANESGIEYDEKLPRYIRITDFGYDGRLNEDKKLSLPFEIAKDYLLKDGDILFARSGATVGKAYQFKFNLRNEKFYCYAGYLIKAEPDSKIIFSDVLNYYTQSISFENWKNLIFNKATIENIGADKYAELRVPIPPLHEQEAIARFLDDKCAKIDELVAIKELQIDKLKELRQVKIHQAVTKGINPNVEMKDSGIDWIGEIPKHWEVKRLKNILKERNERSINGEQPLLMMSQMFGLVLRKDFHSKEQVAKTKEGNKIVYPNDLVFNKLKPHLGVFFKNRNDIIGCVSPDYAVYYSNSLFDILFLEYLFKTSKYISQFKLKASGIVEGLIRLYTDDLFSIHIALPPFLEQKSIIEYLEQATNKIDQAIAQREAQIEKLKAYKQSLINEVVTGKVRVA